MHSLEYVSQRVEDGIGPVPMDCVSGVLHEYMTNVRHASSPPAMLVDPERLELVLRVRRRQQDDGRHETRV